MKSRSSSNQQGQKIQPAQSDQNRRPAQMQTSKDAAKIKLDEQIVSRQQTVPPRIQVQNENRSKTNQIQIQIQKTDAAQPQQACCQSSRHSSRQRQCVRTDQAGGHQRTERQEQDERARRKERREKILRRLEQLEKEYVKDPETPSVSAISIESEESDQSNASSADGSTECTDDCIDGPKWQISKKNQRIPKLREEAVKVAAECAPCRNTLKVISKANIWGVIFSYPRITMQGLQDFRDKVPDVLYPWDEAYNTARLLWNKRINYFPAVICYPRTHGQVAYAFNWTLEHKIPLHIRSGGHSLEGYSSGRGFVLDLSKMDEIEIFKDEETVRFQSGALTGPLYELLQKEGFVLPAGTCSNVGLTGLVQGGGVGFLMRNFGLTIDSVLEFKVLLANGRLVTANSQRHTDLFWALKGAGGGQFGIVLETTCRIYRLTKVALFTMEFDWACAVDVLDAWQNWAPYADKRMTAQILLKGEKRGVIVTGEFVGPKREMKVVLAPFMAIVGSKRKYSRLWSTSYTKAAQFYADGNKKPAFVKVKTDFAYQPFSRDIIAGFIDRLKIKDETEFDVVAIQAMGGAIDEQDPELSCYFHRKKALFWVEYIAYWPNYRDGEWGKAWLHDAYQYLSDYVSGFIYVNFPDPSFPPDQAAWAYWGDNYKRLQHIKTKYDPDDVFNQPQSIKPLLRDDTK